MNPPGFLCYVVGAGRPKKLHATLEAARTEAQRLASTEPDLVVWVYGPLESYDSPPGTVKQPKPKPEPPPPTPKIVKVAQPEKNIVVAAPKKEPVVVVKKKRVAVEPTDGIVSLQKVR